MKRSRIIFLAAIVLATLLIAMSTSVLANGRTPAGSTSPTTPPAGAGPGEAASAISIAPISAIQQRGHVDNMCESQVMMMDLIKQTGAQRTVGDYQVAYLLDPPRGYYAMTDGQLTWVPPAPGETQHIEAVVMDSLTGKMVPVSPVTIDVIDQSGNVVQSKQLAYYWHPMADHYGANFSIPTSGNYSLRVRAPAPDIRRHNRDLGDRFTTPVDVTFASVRIAPITPPATEAQPGTTTPAGAGPTQTTPDMTPAPGTPADPTTPGTPPAAPDTPDVPDTPDTPVEPPTTPAT